MIIFLTLLYYFDNYQSQGFIVTTWLWNGITDGKQSSLIQTDVIINMSKMIFFSFRYSLIVSFSKVNERFDFFFFYVGCHVLPYENEVFFHVWVNRILERSIQPWKCIQEFYRVSIHDAIIVMIEDGR